MLLSDKINMISAGNIVITPTQCTFYKQATNDEYYNKGIFPIQFVMVKGGLSLYVFCSVYFIGQFSTTETNNYAHNLSVTSLLILLSRM